MPRIIKRFVIDIEADNQRSCDAALDSAMSHANEAPGFVGRRGTRFYAMRVEVQESPMFRKAGGRN